MNAKIRVSQRNMNKVLDIIANYKKARKGIVYVDDSFYNALLPLDKVKVNQTLNALQAEGVIEIFKSDKTTYLFCIQLTSEAFVYRKQNKESNTMFWIPTILSIIAIIISILK